MKHLDSYNKNFTFLENNYELISRGTNKRVYYRNDNTVLKLYNDDKDYLQNEKTIYQTLVNKNINFFVPKTKFLNNFVSVSQFADPITVYSSLSPPLPADYNIKIMKSREKIFNYNPLDIEIWKYVCNELIDSNGNIPFYNWGIRKGRLLLLDFETITIEKAIDFFKDIKNIQKFKNGIEVK